MRFHGHYHRKADTGTKTILSKTHNAARLCRNRCGRFFLQPLAAFVSLPPLLNDYFTSLHSEKTAARTSRLSRLYRSSSGIGRATAVEICRQGGKVTLHGRDANKLQEVADECKLLNSIEPPQIVGDITDPGIQKRLLDETVSKYEKLDCLVSNAGCSSYGGVDRTSPEDLRLMLEVHCIAPFTLAKLATPHLVKSRGSIVNVSSVVGQAASNVVLAYSTAKGALDSLTRALAMDLGAKGVRVNSVNPGVIMDTDIGRVSRIAFEAPRMLIAARKLNDSAIEREPKSPEIPMKASRRNSCAFLVITVTLFWMTPDRYPLARMGKSEEVAKAIIHLSTATFTTGENYRVDGGLLAGCYWARDM